MNFKWIKFIWSLVNKISPEARSMLIILLFGYILYNQITIATKQQIQNLVKEQLFNNKQAEKYSMETSIEINRQVQLIADKDTEAFDVLLLNYHNNTQSLQGYKYLYLSCLTEAPRTLDAPLLKQQWNKLDYIYYADELAKIHNQSFVQFDNVEEIGKVFPKLYRLVKASDAKSISFFTIVGHNSPIGLIVLLYKDEKVNDEKNVKKILPCIQRLAILLDYEGNMKK